MTVLTTDLDIAGDYLSGQRVVIFGLGLMGGSLAAALHGKVAHLTGIDPDPLARSVALMRGLVDQAAPDALELLSDATLVILAAPVRTIISLIHDLPRWHSGRAVVLDLGSTKVEISAALGGLPERLTPVGGHPICGKEKGTVVNAEAELFQEAPFILVDQANSTAPARRLAEQLARGIGAVPIWMDAQMHDRWMAATSHFPYLLANTLAACTPVEASTLIGPGFRSTARLAPSPVRMMLDILATNQANVLASLERFRRRLDLLEDALSQQDYNALDNLLSEGANSYETLLLKGEKKSDR
jgi:prephenate dehydrogenase